MESTCIWEQKTIINELTEGMELAKQLRHNLSSESSPETRELLLQKILSSYDNALLILKWSELTVMQQQQPAQQVAPPPMTGLPESPISIDDSPRSGDMPPGFNDQHDRKAVSKKRKALPTWTDQVRICTDNGLEGNTDDGYSWRKYGQKDILGAKFPRSYYRCTYRNVQNCLARKQVQRTDEDPTVFEITYKGKHTCNHGALLVLPPASPEKHEIKQNRLLSHREQPKSDEILSNLRATLRVNTEDLGTSVQAPFTFPSTSTSFGYMENQHFPFSTLVNNDLLQGYSPPFISPVTSGSNYFTESNFGWSNDLHQTESNLTGLVSATTSVTNSPIVDLPFLTDPVDLDPNFPFNSSGFFT